VPIPFADYAARVQQHIEQAYGIPVLTRDIPDPLTGDLDGAEIALDYAIAPEQRLFLLGHLFGHTVQWNTDPGTFDIGKQYKPPVDEKLFPAVLAYEGEAARYGLALFRQSGLADDELKTGFPATPPRIRPICCTSIAPAIKETSRTSGPPALHASKPNPSRPSSRSSESSAWMAW
jgi:hypothetical protein